MVLMRSTRERKYLKKKLPSPIRKPCINSIPLPIERPSPLPALKGYGFTYFQQRDKSNNITDYAVDNIGSSKTHNINNNHSVKLNCHPKFGEVFSTPDAGGIRVPEVGLNHNVVLRGDGNDKKRNQGLIPQINEQKDSAEQIHTPISCTTLTTKSNSCVVNKDNTYQLIEQALLEQRKIQETQLQKNHRILNNPNNIIGWLRHNKRKKWKLSSDNSNTFPSIPGSSIPRYHSKHSHKSQAKIKTKLPPIFSFSKLKKVSFRYINLQSKTTFLMQNQNTYDKSGTSRNCQYTNDADVDSVDDTRHDCPVCQLDRDGDINQITQIFCNKPYDLYNSDILERSHGLQQDEYGNLQENSNICSNPVTTLTDKSTGTNINNTYPNNQSDFSKQNNDDRMCVLYNDSKQRIAPNIHSRFNQYQPRISLPNENISRSYPDPFVDHNRTYYDPRSLQSGKAQLYGKNIIGDPDCCKTNTRFNSPELDDLRYRHNNDIYNKMSHNPELKKLNDCCIDKSNNSNKNYPAHTQTASTHNTSKQYLPLPVPNITKNIPLQNEGGRRKYREHTQTQNLNSLKDFPNSIQAGENQMSRNYNIPNQHLPVPNIDKNIPLQNDGARTNRSFWEHAQTQNQDSLKHFPNSIQAGENQLSQTYNTPNQYLPVPNIAKNNTQNKGSRTNRSLREHPQTQNLDSVKDFQNSIRASENQVSPSKSSYINNTARTSDITFSKNVRPSKHRSCAEFDEKKKQKNRVTCMCQDFSSDTKSCKEFCARKAGTSTRASKTLVEKVHDVTLCQCQIKACNCRYPPAYKQFTCAGNMSGNCSCSDNNLSK